jgi:hypothetical protein
MGPPPEMLVPQASIALFHAKPYPTQNPIPRKNLVSRGITPLWGERAKAAVRVSLQIAAPPTRQQQVTVE